MKKLLLITLLLFSQFAFSALQEGTLANGTSMAASFNSSALIVKNNAISLQAVFSGGGSPTGTFKLQSSNDVTYTAASVTNWDDIASSSQAITTDGTLTWDLTQFGSKWIRVVYTYTSGTGTVNVNYFSKGN